MLDPLPFHVTRLRGSRMSHSLIAVCVDEYRCPFVFALFCFSSHYVILKLGDRHHVCGVVEENISGFLEKVSKDDGVDDGELELIYLEVEWVDDEYISIDDQVVDIFNMMIDHHDRMNREDLYAEGAGF